MRKHLSALSVLALLAISLCWSLPSKADGPANQRVFQVGQQTDQEIMLFVCIDEEEAERPVMHYQNALLKQADPRLSFFEARIMRNQQLMFGLCRFISDRLTITAVLWTRPITLNDQPGTVTIVSLRVGNEDEEVFADLYNVEVRSGEL